QVTIDRSARSRRVNVWSKRGRLRLPARFPIGFQHTGAFGRRRGAVWVPGGRDQPPPFMCCLLGCRRELGWPEPPCPRREERGSVQAAQRASRTARGAGRLSARRAGAVRV